MSFSRNICTTSYSVHAIETPTSELGEAPHWDGTRQSLYYVDIFAKEPTILRYDAVLDRTFVAVVENVVAPVSFIIPVDGSVDEFAISIDGNVEVIRWDGTSNLATVVRHGVTVEPGRRMNDAKADPYGRLFCGIMPLKMGADVFVHTADANLYRYASDDTEPVVVADRLGLPNGLTWNAKKAKFYYVDSLAFDIKEYDYDGKTGDLTFKRVLIDFKVNGERPKFHADGLTIDANGSLYVALFNGSKVLKINATSGAIDMEIVLPVPSITSVAFGGPQLEVLYVTTSSIHLEHTEQPPLAGAVFKVTGLGVKGLPMNKVRV